jgi:hypothetical protein
MTEKPQASKRTRRTQPPPKHGFCRLCGEPVHNIGAHGEACRGRPVRVSPDTARAIEAGYEPPKRCQARIRGRGGAWILCTRYWAHPGEHLFP